MQLEKIIVNVIAFCASKQWSFNLCGIQQHSVLQGGQQCRGVCIFLLLTKSHLIFDLTSHSWSQVWGHLTATTCPAMFLPQHINCSGKAIACV